MNHIAHCFLSFTDEDLLLGNFIGDFVKGKTWQTYAPAVQRGILLHRQIDAFTDEHPMTRTSTARLRPYAGRYAAPLVDILYDHLLCLHWSLYTKVHFDEFAEWVYQSLDKRVAEMPPELQERWPYMRAGRFLHGYRSREGLEWVLRQFSRRLDGKFDPAAMAAFFFVEIEAFADDFNVFFPDLVKRVADFREDK